MRECTGMDETVRDVVVVDFAHAHAHAHDGGWKQELVS